MSAPELPAPKYWLVDSADSEFDYRVYTDRSEARDDAFEREEPAQLVELYTADQMRAALAQREAPSVEDRERDAYARGVLDGKKMAAQRPAGAEPVRAALISCAKALLGGIRKAAQDCLRTRSRDITDWQDDMAAIEKMASEALDAFDDAAPPSVPVPANLTDGQIVEIRDSLLPNQGERFDCIAFARAVLAAQPSAPAEGWRPMDTAPKDGTRIIARCEHENAKHCAAAGKDPVAEGWIAAVAAYWIDHNGGGWTWHGLCGEFTGWAPLPPLAAAPSQPTAEAPK